MTRPYEVEWDGPRIEALPSDEIARQFAILKAVIRERQARDLALASLPTRLRRLVDHPRILGLAYKLRPTWRPVITVEELEPLEGLSAAALKAMDPPRYRTGGMMRP